MDNKYRISGDLHAHTIASQHAYSTISEMVDRSKELGMDFIAITDHGPEMLDGAIRHHFLCLPGLPDVVEGIRLYKGAEVNIKSFAGRIDLDSQVLARLDFVIASYHIEAITPGTVEENYTPSLPISWDNHQLLETEAIPQMVRSMNPLPHI